MLDTIIVVPCFNEAGRLDVDAFRRFVATHADVGFVLVDDGSADETLDVLAKLHDEDPRAFTIEVLEKNSGKAEAVRTGMNKAFALGARYAGYWDADLSTPLEQIPDFRAVFDRRPGTVAVLGSRVRRLGADVRRDPLRHYLGRIFATLASLVLGLPVYDTQCGAKMFRVRDDVKALFAEPFLSRWVFDVEILARFRAACRRAGTSSAEGVFELPLDCWHDIAGSKLKGGHMIAALLDLLRIRRRYR